MRWEPEKATGGPKAYRLEMGRFAQSRSTRGLVAIGCIHCDISVSEPCERGVRVD